MTQMTPEEFARGFAQAMGEEANRVLPKDAPTRLATLGLPSTKRGSGKERLLINVMSDGSMKLYLNGGITLSPREVKEFVRVWQSHRLGEEYYYDNKNLKFTARWCEIDGKPFFHSIMFDTHVPMNHDHRMRSCISSKSAAMAGLNAYLRTVEASK